MSLLLKAIFGNIATFYCGFYVVWKSLMGHRFKDWYRGLDIFVQHTLATAEFFHIFHAIALFIVVFSLSSYLGCTISTVSVATLFSLGIFFFSFSLYARFFFSIGGKFSWITPLGGVCLLLGWFILFLRMLVILYVVTFGGGTISCR